MGLEQGQTSETQDERNNNVSAELKGYVNQDPDIPSPAVARASTAEERERLFQLSRRANAREVDLLAKVLNYKYGHYQETSGMARYQKEELQKMLKAG